MAHKPTLQERIDVNDRLADAVLDDMKRPQTSEREFVQLLRKYLLYKFMLEEDECSTDVILDLCQMSVDKLLMLHDRSVELGAASMTCSGATTVAVKKVLLIIALQKALEIEKIPAEIAVELTTIDMLGTYLYNAFQIAHPNN